ncbi:unannotated protein [freshwater metagenome]|uniref:Unannotated protein n=1 Tax=freshwater metagenome TaxID=449393 RepID=A0A6J7MCJ2_9ZZZZ
MEFSFVVVLPKNSCRWLIPVWPGMTIGSTVAEWLNAQSTTNPPPPPPSRAPVWPGCACAGIADRTSAPAMPAVIDTAAMAFRLILMMTPDVVVSG